MSIETSRDKLILVSPLVNTQREGGVQEHATHTTHCLSIIAGSSNTGGAIHGSVVHSTLSSPLQSDEPIFPPVLPPTVPHQPVGEGPTKNFN